MELFEKTDAVASSLDFNFLNVEYIIRLVYLFFTGGAEYPLDGPQPGTALFYLLYIVHPLLWLIALLLGVLFLAGMIYAAYGLYKIRAQEYLVYGKTEEDLAPEGVPVDVVKQRWQQVLLHADSENPNDWRLAIIEADIMLDDMVKLFGYRGETLGDRLKSIEKSDFTTIDDAWEAHKVRNAIAHQGSDFLLTKRETKRVIDLYRKVFQEFHYINY